MTLDLSPQTEAHFRNSGSWCWSILEFSRGENSNPISFACTHGLLECHSNPFCCFPLPAQRRHNNGVWRQIMNISKLHYINRECHQQEFDVLQKGALPVGREEWGWHLWKLRHPIPQLHAQVRFWTKVGFHLLGFGAPTSLLTHGSTPGGWQVISHTSTSPPLHLHLPQSEEPQKLHHCGLNHWLCQHLSKPRRWSYPLIQQDFPSGVRPLWSPIACFANNIIDCFPLVRVVHACR